MKRVILITARAGFPNGYGATSIIRKYSKGFLNFGYNTKVLLLRPSEYKHSKVVLNSEAKGTYEGVEYEYMTGTSYTHNSIFIRFWRYCVALIRTIIFIISYRSQIKKIFFYSPDYLLSTLLIQIFCNLLKIELVGIKTESSLSDTQRTKNRFWRIKERLIYRYFEEMIVITKHLKNQLREFGYTKRVTILPIVVDEDMFNKVKVDEREFSLVYIGTLNYKDELIALIEIFSLVQQKYKDIKLRIIGEFVSGELKSIIQGRIEDLKLSNNIIWNGKVAANEIPNYLSKGAVMVLPRVAGEYSKAGFPIKLGEYLLSGSPTVVTRTGDIDEYLSDGVNSFLVEPNSNVLFAQKVINVLDDYENSLNVGKNGRELAIGKFGTKKICKVMLEG